MPFGYSLFDSDGDGSVGDAMASKRVDPLGSLHQRRAGHTVQRSPLPKKPTPSHADVHGHLDAAKSASSDQEKRGHVFKALTALNRRMGKNPQPLPDMGAT